MRKEMLYLPIFIFSLLSVNAANIYGSIYDISLDKVENSVVEINTNPSQRFVAVNGTYSFEVPSGSYTIMALYQEKGEDMYTEENITIVDDGSYVIDLFLYPLIDGKIYDDLELDIENPYGSSAAWQIVIVIVLAISAYAVFRPKKTIKVKDDLHKIILLLEKNNGRMTQRELRKEFPLSEAKISLMITELEALGKVKKIKKGRGNVIILDK